MDGDGIAAANEMAQQAVRLSRDAGRQEGLRATAEEIQRHRVAEVILRALADAAASAAQDLSFAPAAQKAFGDSARLYRDLAETYRTAAAADQPELRDPEGVAAAFHSAYEALAPEHGYETREESATDWANVPEENKSLMIATVGSLMEQGVIRPGPAPSAGDATAEAEPETVK